MASQTVENYLKTIFLLSNNSGEIGLSEISLALNVSTPTANSMVKKLAELKLLKYEKYKPLRLTERGKKEAALIIRKHRLTEMFLVDIMHFGWEEVHDIAEQIEHINSSLFFDRMDELLEYPTIDPHGSPIPDKDGKMNWKTYTSLCDAKPGHHYKLAALKNSSDEFLKYLNTKKLALGTTIKVEHIEPFDKSMSVSYKKHDHEMLSFQVCEKLLVEKLDK